MTRFQTAHPKHLQYLYHWQRFVPEYLTTLLREQTIWCSNPATFNDPWDCKPFFNTEALRDEGERERHIEWYAEITRVHRPDIPPDFIARTQQQLRDNPVLLTERIVKASMEMWPAVAERYRVYCLGPDIHNTLMWALYADNHRGVCLEFSTRNTVMCCALGVQYSRDFPITRAYSNDDVENLVPLLTKSDVWSYEREYRLVAQESNKRTKHDTLITENNYLRLPDNALTSIIVGCQGPFEDVRSLVNQFAPQVQVRRAERIPNRYALHIS